MALSSPNQNKKGFMDSMRNITRRQSIDTGMAVTLLMLLVAIFTSMTNGFLVAALISLLVTMIAPGILKPVAVLWFGFSNRLGRIMSTVLLSIIYAVIIVPIGWCRQKFGKDTLFLNDFEKKNTSFFRERKHQFSKADLINPY